MYKLRGSRDPAAVLRFSGNGPPEYSLDAAEGRWATRESLLLLFRLRNGYDLPLKCAEQAHNFIDICEVGITLTNRWEIPLRSPMPTNGSKL